MNRIALTALASISVSTLVARAQSPAAPPAGDSTRLTTQLNTSTQKTREVLVKDIEKLILQITITDDLLASLQKNNDGTRETRSKIVLLALVKEHDRTKLMAPVAVSMEQLRFAMEKEKLGYASLITRRELNVKETQVRIDTTATAIIDQEKKLKWTMSPDERSAIESRIAEMKVELEAQIALKEDRQRSVQDYTRALRELDKEQSSLKGLENWIDHESRLALTRVESLGDAVQQGAQDALKVQSDEGRKTLHTAAELIRKIRNTPYTPQGIVPKVPPLPDTVEKTRAKTTVGPEVEAELERHRSRSGNGKTTSKP